MLKRMFVLLITMLSVGVGTDLEARTMVRIDKRWGMTGALPNSIQRVAVCPAVLFNEDAAVSEATAQLIYNQLLLEGRGVLSPELAISAMGNTLHERAKVRKALDKAVRSGFDLDSSLVGPITRSLRVDGLLIVRIERWDVLPSDRPTMSIEAVANLVDSTGRSLWRCWGRASTMDPAEGRNPDAGLDGGAHGQVGDQSVTKALATVPGAGAIGVPENTRVETQSKAQNLDAVDRSAMRSGSRISAVDPRFQTALDSLCSRLALNVPRMLITTDRK